MISKGRFQLKNVFIPPDLVGDGLPITLEDGMPLLFLGPSMLQNYLKGDSNNLN
jgi:hypothetical protein